MAKNTQSLPNLVKNFLAVGPQLVKDEISLATVQLKDAGKKGGKGGALLGVAAVFGVLGISALVIAMIFGLAKVFQPWLAALIGALILFVVAGIVALMGKKSLDKAFKSVDAVGDAGAGIGHDVKILKEGSSAGVEPTKEIATISDEPKQEKKEETRSPEQLKQRIVAERDYLGETVDELGQKLDFRSRGKEMFEDITDTTMHKATDLKDAAVEAIEGKEKKVGAGVALGAGIAGISAVFGGRGKKSKNPLSDEDVQAVADIDDSPELEESQDKLDAAAEKTKKAKDKAEDALEKEQEAKEEHKGLFAKAEEKAKAHLDLKEFKDAADDEAEDLLDNDDKSEAEEQKLSWSERRAQKKQAEEVADEKVKQLKEDQKRAEKEQAESAKEDKKAKAEAAKAEKEQKAEAVKAEKEEREAKKAAEKEAKEQREADQKEAKLAEKEKASEKPSWLERRAARKAEEKAEAESQVVAKAQEKADKALQSRLDDADFDAIARKEQAKTDILDAQEGLDFEEATKKAEKALSRKERKAAVKAEKKADKAVDKELSRKEKKALAKAQEEAEEA